MYAPIDVIFDSNEVGTTQVGGTTDNPIYTLLPAIEKCVGIAVTYANIPFTYYVIDNTCNTFTFQYVKPTDISPVIVTNYAVTITPGTYNATNFAIQLKAAIERTAYSGPSLEIFVDQTTSKLVIYATTAIFSQQYFGFLFSTQQQILSKIMGFPVGQSISDTSDFVDDNDNSITGLANLAGTKVVNLSGPSQMFLDSDLGSLIFGSVRNQAGNRGLLGFWPVNTNYQGTIEFVNLNPEMIPMTEAKISRLNLSLTLGNRTLYNATGSATPYLQLNGEPFQIGLRFWKEISEGVDNIDSLGNRSIQVHSNPRLYDPKKMKRKDIF